MRNIIEDFELLYVLAALCGLFAGWLLWSWRHRSLPIDEHERLIEFEANARSRIDALTVQRDQARTEHAAQQTLTGRNDPPPAAPRLSTFLTGDETASSAQSQQPEHAPAQLGAAQNQIAALVVERDELMGRLAEAERVASSAGLAEADQVAALVTERDELMVQLTSANDRANVLAAQAAQAAQNGGGAQDELDQLSSKIASQATEVADLRQQLDDALQAQRAAERAAANSQRAFEAASARNRVLEARPSQADTDS